MDHKSMKICHAARAFIIYSRPFSVVLNLLIFIVAQNLVAQDVPIKFQGNLNLSGEVYSASGITGRAPRNGTRLIFTPTITLFDQISLPFEIYISNQDHGYRQPFNQFGVSPRIWNWLTLHAGYFSSQVSELTFGDTRLLGGGIELTPGDFRFSVLYGRSQKAVAIDTVLGVHGIYSRTMLAAKIGYGNPGSWFMDLNFVHSIDDSNSIALPKPGRVSDSVFSNYLTSPTENAVASVSFGMAFSGNLVRIKGEGAVSAFSSDIRMPKMTEYVKDFGPIFTPRASSQMDAAALVLMTIAPMNDFTLNLSGRWVGPGFITLGYAQMPNDVMDLTIGPTLRLFNHTTNLRTSFGVRYNNLRNNHLSTTKRTIVNVGASIQPVQAFGLELNYSNYGMRSNPRNDTLRIDNISQSVMISPRYSFSGLGGTNIFVLNYSLQSFDDFNVVSGSRSSNKTNTGVASWTIVFPSTLSFSTNLMYAHVSASAAKSTIKGVTETVGRSFFENLLTTSLTIGYNAFTVNSTSGQLIGRLGASMNLGKSGTLSLMLSSSRFNYSDPTAGQSYGEYQGSLSYNIHF
jgi:hypothetical protein